MKRSTALTQSQLAELVAFVVEGALSVGHTNVKAQWDVKLPDLRTGTLRQVDVCVTYDVGDREMRRIVEVESKSRKMGSEALDELEGKMEALGAARGTLVSAGSFTGPTLERVAASAHRIDAVTLRKAKLNDWPAQVKAREITFKIGGSAEAVQLVPYVYADAVLQKDRFFVAYGVKRLRDHELVAMLLRASDGSKFADGHDYRLVTLARDLTNTGHPGPTLSHRVSYTMPDGKKEEIVF